MISHISKDIYINTLFYQAHSAKFFSFYIITILVLIGFCVGIRYTKLRDRAYLKRITFSTKLIYLLFSTSLAFILCFLFSYKRIKKHF